MTNHASHYVFVYGSLRRGFQSPAHEYISHYFNFFGDAKVKGKLFDLGEHPGGVPTQEDSFIIGELYIAKDDGEFSWAIAQLDDYEGVVVEPNEKPLYRREIVDVYVNDAIVPAWIYWYNGDVRSKPYIESGAVLKYLAQKK